MRGKLSMLDTRESMFNIIFSTRFTLAKFKYLNNHLRQIYYYGE